MEELSLLFPGLLSLWLSMVSSSLFLFLFLIILALIPYYSSAYSLLLSFLFYFYVTQALLSHYRLPRYESLECKLSALAMSLSLCLSLFSVNLCNPAWYHLPRRPMLFLSLGIIHFSSALYFISIYRLDLFLSIVYHSEKV